MTKLDVVTKGVCLVAVAAASVISSLSTSPLSSSLSKYHASFVTRTSLVYSNKLRLQPRTLFLRSSLLTEPLDRSITTSLISNLAVTTLDDKKVDLKTLIPSNPTKTAILVCLSHFGDFNAWEVAQQYIAAFDAGDFNDNSDIILVGIGSVSSAKTFASDLDLDKIDATITLVSDEIGAVTEAFGCYRGWLAIDKSHAKMWPATDVNPYVKLFGMIFGLGSPGTIEKVLYGYFGDKTGGSRSRKWVIDALLVGSKKGRFPRITEKAFEGVPENSGLRPFELATLRAQTGIHIVRNWDKLGPKNGDLFTRMGGTFVFKGNECVYRYFDKGILSYAAIDAVINAVNNQADL